jgi:predicted permease
MAWFRRVRNLAQTDRLSADIDREIDFHIAERADELVARGMSEEDAAREARRLFGNRAVQRDRTRDADVVGWLESLAADTRYALRALRAHRGFTAVAVLSLGLGIGANTALFSLIDAAMLKPLPVTRPEELVQVTRAADGPDFNNPLWEEFQRRQDAFSGVFAFASERFDLTTGGEVRRADGDWVSGGFFPTLGVRPAAGRLLAPADDYRGCPAVAVVSHAFGRAQYGGAAAAVGKRISLNGHPFTVVGVAEPKFFGVEVGRRSQVYAPLCSQALIRGSEGALDEGWHWYLAVMGRPRAGLAPDEVRARLAALGPAIHAATVPAKGPPEGRQWYLRGRLGLEPAAHGVSALRTRYGSALLALMAVMGVVLLIACANVANLLLARAASRQREIAVRMALGAGRLRLVRQVMVESMILSLAGAAVGVAFSWWASHALVGFLSTRRRAVWLPLEADARVLGFALAVAVATGLLFGVAPARHALRVDLQGAMKARDGRSRERRVAARTLVTGQVALSMVLVVTAGLFLGTFHALTKLDPGFRREGVLLARVDLRNAGFPDERVAGVQRELLERLRALPGVVSASASVLTPISGSGWNGIARAGGAAEGEMVMMNAVTDGYFRTLGTPLVAGRELVPGDRAGAPPVAVVNEAMARRHFGSRSPLGHEIRVEPSPGSAPIQVVGVVRDARYGSLRESAPPTVYLAMAQDEPSPAADFEVRAGGDALALAPAIAREIARLHPGITVEFTTLADQVGASLGRERLLATLSGFLGALALLLAGIGLYGTVSYSVARRRGELGIRMALGAARGRVVRMVLGEVGRMVGVGIAIGAVAALVAGRLISSFLYELAPWDPLTLAASALVLACGALAAGAAPAWRAARMDPVAALRTE